MPEEEQSYNDFLWIKDSAAWWREVHVYAQRPTPTHIPLWPRCLEKLQHFVDVYGHGQQVRSVAGLDIVCVATDNCFTKHEED